MKDPLRRITEMTRDLLMKLTMDDDGRIERCRVSTEGVEPTFVIEHTGSDALDRCAIAVRQHFRMEVYRADFERALMAPRAESAA